MSPEAEALREKLAEGWIAGWGAECDWDSQNPAENQAARAIARILVRELRLAEPEMHVPNALAHKLLPLLELAGPKE